MSLHSLPPRQRSHSLTDTHSLTDMHSLTHTTATMGVGPIIPGQTTVAPIKAMDTAMDTAAADTAIPAIGGNHG